MKGKITIQSAIDELQRMYRFLNDRYFDNELETPVITIHTDTTSGAYGWITVNKVWSSKDEKWFREINITAEHLNRSADLIITTLLHEMCHLYNIQHGIQDTSRGGTYHNGEFKKACEARDMTVEKSDKYGYCITKPTERLTQLVNEKCRVGCFKLERKKTYRDGTPKITIGGGNNGKEKTISRTKQSSRKYTCPSCGLTVRATKDISGKLMCVDCSCQLIES